MKNNILLLLVFSLSTSLLKAAKVEHKSFINGNQNAAVTLQDSLPVYPLSIRFLSVCCGVPTDTPLIKCVKKFKKRHKMNTIVATRIGPLGREGEYDLAFELKGWSLARKKDFIKKMKLVTSQMKDKGKAMVQLDATYDPSRLPARLSFEKVEF